MSVKAILRSWVNRLLDDDRPHAIYKDELVAEYSRKGRAERLYRSKHFQGRYRFEALESWDGREDAGWMILVPDPGGVIAAQVALIPDGRDDE